MKASSAATVNGCKPLPKVDIHDYGTRGSEGNPSKGSVSQSGAKEGPDGKHIASPGASQPDLNSPKAAGERISTGTTAEEQKKRIAAQMYPSSKGLREYGAGSAL